MLGKGPEFLCGESGILMFRYLIFCGAGLYLALLIGGEDRGQERMGLRGAYAIDVTTPPVTLAETEPKITENAPVIRAAAPADTIRILPVENAAATPAVLEQPAEPAFNDFNNPTVILRTITAEAANVRDAASRNGAIVDRVTRGEIVQMVDQVGDWVHIRIEGDGVEGFVHRRLISTEPPSLSTYSLFPASD